MTVIVEDGPLGQATFSECLDYRYLLTRKPTNPRPIPLYDLITFLLMNPSIADHKINDPTVAKCCKYAGAWGARNVMIINAFAYRSTGPTELLKQDDPVGVDNNSYIMEVAKRSSLVICGWGIPGKILNRGRGLTAQMLGAEINSLHYLKLNNDGSPSRPLYLKDSLIPQPWTTANEYADGKGLKMKRTKILP